MNLKNTMIWVGMAAFLGVAPMPVFAEEMIVGGFMTGGGKLSGSDKVTHGFNLHCDVAEGANNLQVNWGKGAKFHLEILTDATCTNDPLLDPEEPTTVFDTYAGEGMGSYNGVSGATATWVMTDAGEPGKDDTFHITVQDVDGNTVLDASGALNGGNHQAHDGAVVVPPGE
jgi:hypothetical protein